MLSSNEIRDVKFSKSVGGYKQEEVDILLDKVEADYEQYERAVREMSAKIESLNSEIEEMKISQGSLQNVLMSAQKLADQIVADAKAKSEAIVDDARRNIVDIQEQEKQLSEEFSRNAEARKEAAEKEYEIAVADAKRKQESIDKATADSIARQQKLFNKLKLEIVAFKKEIINKYEEHMKLLSVIPDEVDMSPEEIAAAVSEALDRTPNPQDFIDALVNNSEAEETHEAVVDEVAEPVEEESGFVIMTDDMTEEEF